MATDHLTSLTLSSKDVAQKLSISVATVNNWAKSEKLPAYRVGHSWIVVRSQFEAWLAATTDPSVEVPTLTVALASLPPTLRVDEVAALLHVSDALARRLIDERSLGAYDLGTLHRVPREALLRWFEDVSNDYESAVV